MVRPKFHVGLQNWLMHHLKVEATKFTEVGYVGRDVEQIIRDLVETAIAMIKEKNEKKLKLKRTYYQRKELSTPLLARMHQSTEVI